MAQAMDATTDGDAKGSRIPEGLLAAGDQLGRYRIERLLGSGGMGSVYQAEDLQSGRTIALKVLNHRLHSPQHRGRFLREGRLAASLNHPNSVYIFGTEEIDETPVITMELVEGGNLEQLVKQRGALSIGEAVDFILDVIDGLDAAHQVGVLHRDIKPANCFVARDGCVKIGDFGLSISTGVRQETNLTQSGVFLGTPLFSSPEQLRGDELDVRSDIYSVGVTLFVLLTGHPPFEGRQMVQLLATVLEKPAPQAKSVRSEIPADLSRIVSRCLEKRKEQRYASYDDLRRALQPYRSHACSPATIGLRILASLIDHLVLIALAVLLPLLWAVDAGTWHSHYDALSEFGPQPSPSLNLISLGGAMVLLLYFSFTEGRYGASIGKRICRLRVVDPDGGAAGMPRAFLRVAIFAAAHWLPWWLLYAIDPQSAVTIFAADTDTISGNLLGIACSFLFLVLFVTGRRGNGYAGLHELVSGTRTISLPAIETRPKLKATEATDPIGGPSRDEGRIGPFHVLERLDSNQLDDLLLGYDTRLLRKVWIRRFKAPVPELTARLRRISRIGRLHWLAGGQQDDQRWEAYEAPSGGPLLALPAAERTWSATRFWLADLARELVACQEDQADEATTLPVLALDRIWITSDGRAMLLDIPAPPGRPIRSIDHAASRPSESPALFLKRVTLAALEDKLLGDSEAAATSFTCRIPVSARQLLDDLDRDVDLKLVAERLEQRCRRPANVSSSRRGGVLAACFSVAALALAFFIPLGMAERATLRANPELGALTGYVSFYQALDPAGVSDEELFLLDESSRLALVGHLSTQQRNELKRDVELVVANRYRETIEKLPTSTSWAERELIGDRSRAMLLGWVETRFPATDDELTDASERLATYRPTIDALAWRESDYALFGSFIALIIAFAAVLTFLFCALPGVLCSLLLGFSPLLRALDCDVVNSRGRVASRIRLTFRSVLFWTFVLACMGVLAVGFIYQLPRLPLALFFLVAIPALADDRGPHGLISRTWLVPR